MEKKYVGWLALYMACVLLITLLGTLIQFAYIGHIMPIWHLRYSEVDAYAAVAFLWLLMPCEYLYMADTLRALQRLDEEETSE